MAATVFDSPLYAGLFPSGETGRLFSDSAALRAMLLTEGALAKVQGQAGVIPEISAAAIHRASHEISIDPGALSKTTGQNGVCIPGLVAAFKAEMNAPEHAQYVHWGATSQDIIDTGLMLRLRQALVLAEQDMIALLRAMAQETETHANTKMVARTYGQLATPTTWGAVIAQWGNPLVDALQALPDLRKTSLWVSLSGASGTSSALGDTAPALRASLAENLGLTDPERSWHTDRSPILRIANWLADTTATLGGMGSTVAALSASGLEEVGFSAAGASSTMPQKQNPVAATALVALSHQMATLRAGFGTAAVHQHQRDGTAWFTEWMLLPQIVLSAASARRLACRTVEEIRPESSRMQAVLEDGLGLFYAEALSFALCNSMPRTQALEVTKTLCAQAKSENRPLQGLAKEAYPNLPDATFDPLAQSGQAVAAATKFVARVNAL